MHDRFEYSTFGEGFQISRPCVVSNLFQKLVNFASFPTISRDLQLVALAIESKFKM